MLAHQICRRMDLSVAAQTHEVIMVRVPSGKTILISEQTDDEARTGDENANKFGQDLITGEVGHQKMEPPRQVDRLADATGVAQGSLSSQIVFEKSDVLWVGSRSDGFRRPTLDRHPCREDVASLSCIGRGDEDASVRQADEQPFPCEPLQSGTNDATTEPESLDQGELGQLRSRQQPLIDDGLEEVIVDVVHGPGRRPVTGVHHPDHPRSYA